MKRIAVVVALLAFCIVPVTAQAADAPTGKSAATSGANVKGAKKHIAPYLKRATPFPVDKPLKKKLPADYTVGIPVVGTPVGALLGRLWESAAQTAGVKSVTVKAGVTPSDTESAFDSLLAKKPDAIPVGGINPSFFVNAVKRAKAQGAKVTGTSIINPAKYGIQASTYDQRVIALDGKLLADWAIAKHGAKTNAVFWVVPELAFTKTMGEAFTRQLKVRCPKCKVRTANIPVTQYGTAATRIVSDMQSHRGTNVAAFGATEAANAAPAALRTAGIKVDIIGQGTDPVSLGNLKSGNFKAMIAFDAGVLAWTTLDEAFRLSLKQPLTKLEKASLIPIRLLEPKTVPKDISKGYSAYPNFAARFAKLWNPR